MRNRIALAGFLVALLSSMGYTTAAAVACSEERIAVSLGPERPRDLVVAATLCLPSTSVLGAVQLLLPGATVGRAYWDFPVDPARYSYARALAGAGIATLAIDRIGSCCESSTPFSAEVTLDVDAWVAHSLVQALRHGEIGGRSFSNVSTAAHSGGSAVVVLEATRYQDVDGVIVSGALHRLNLVTLPEFVSYFEPAVFDEKFADSGLDPGYTTARPELRYRMMHGPDVDPIVVATDEALKTTTTIGQHYGMGQFFGAPPAVRTEDLDVPVLVAVGSLDALLCGGTATDCSSTISVRAAEAAHYPNAGLDVFVLPQAGHMLNLAPNTAEWHGAAIAWTSSILNS